MAVHWDRRALEGGMVNALNDFQLSFEELQMFFLTSLVIVVLGGGCASKCRVLVLIIDPEVGITRLFTFL